MLTNYQADPDHLRVMASARCALERGRKLQVLFAGFAPGPVAPTAMVNPRVRELLKSSRPDAEWHSGELETAMVPATRPELVRRDVARRLPPVWADYRNALERGARNFWEIAPGGLGYFGSPAVARARIGRAAMTLRARLIARELLQALRRWRGP